MARRTDPKAEALAQLEEARASSKTQISLHAVDAEILERVCELTWLRELRLSGTFARLPDVFCALVELRSLYVESCGLVALPADIGRLVHLETLHAYSNKLKALPESFGELRSLRDFVGWENQLGELPESFGRLRSLKSLDLKWNQLASLPRSFGELAALEELELSSNQLSAVPEGFERLASLRRLALEDNSFREIPAAIAGLPALQELVLKENEIKAFAPEAFASRSLAVLDLAENKIAKIPASLRDLSALVELDLSENPIKGCPEEVVEGGIEEIRMHFGWVATQTLTGDLPTPRDRKAIVARYEERIEEFVRDTRHKLVDAKMLDKLLAFVRGETDEMPPGRAKDHYAFGQVVEILADPAAWTFVDRRIIAFVAQAAWEFRQPGHDYTTGYHDELFKWLAERVQTPGAFGIVAEALLARGIDRDALVRRALLELREHLVEGERPTSFGSWILDRVDVLLPVLAQASKDWVTVREAVVSLLMDHPIFDRIGEDLLALTPDDDGEIHLPDVALARVCAREPARWEALLLEGIERAGDCLGCKAEGGKILAEAYGERHRAKAFAIAREVLAGVSAKKNGRDHGYDLPWSGAERYSDGTPAYIGWMFRHFGAEAREPVAAYVDRTRVLDVDVLDVVAAALGQAGVDILAEGLSISFDDDSIAPTFERVFALLRPFDWSKWHGEAWELAGAEQRKVRRTACAALALLPESTVLPKTEELLASKKAAHREAAATILALLGTPAARARLDALIDVETVDDVRDLAVQRRYGPDDRADAVEVTRRIESAKRRGKLAKPVAGWLDEAKLPALSWVDGAKVEPAAVRFLLQRQTRPTDLAVDAEARAVLARVDRSTSGPFAAALLDLVLKNGGANAKNRFALALVGLLGDDRVVPKLEKLAVNDRNLPAVATLGLLATKESARALDRVMRAFRLKYPNVREAAEEAFADVAQRMGLTPFELADAMLPDFAFTRSPFVVGKQALSLAITPDRKLRLVDGRKILKSPPKDATPKQKAELKELSAQVDLAAEALGASLEQYLVGQRRWTTSDWLAFFLVHPLAVAFARSLVWGTSTGAFRVAADARMLAADGTALASGEQIWLVHPLDLPSDARAAWDRVLDDEGVFAPFAQIDRPVFTVAPEDRARTRFFGYDDQEVDGAAFKRDASRRGWRRGSVVDAGEVSTYRKTYALSGIDAFLRLEGMPVQAAPDDDVTVTLRELFFVRTGAVATGSYVYDEPRTDDDPRLIPLGAVPPIVWSETIADLTALTGTSDEEDEDEEDDD